MYQSINQWIRTTVIVVILVLSAISLNAQTTYTTYDASGNWSTDGGTSDCSCSPTAGAGNLIVVKHNSCSGALSAGTGCFSEGNTLTNYSSIIVETGGAFYVSAGFNSGNVYALQTVQVDAGGEMYVFGGSQFYDPVALTVNGTMEINGGTNFFTNNWTLNGTFNITGASNCFGCDITGTGSFGTCSSISAVFSGTAPLINGSDEAGNDLCSVLPIELAYFNGEYDNGHVDLSWLTLSENNNDYFIVQRSADGIYFEDIARVDGGGNSITELSYETVDSRPDHPIAYYRLLQVDYDGHVATFPIIAVETGQVPLTIYPNPTTGEIRIENTESSESLEKSSSMEDPEYEVKMYSVHGDLMKSFSFIGVLYEGNVADLVSGTYIVEVTGPNGVFREKFVKL
jgi:hypothetical protein